MDPKELRGLYEAYKQVNAPQEVDEAVKGESSERRKDLAAERKSGHRPLPAKEGEKYASHKLSQMAYAKRKRMGEEVEAVDEATAMAKRGYDEAPIRQKIAKSTGGGKAADRASALEKKSTFGDAKKEKQRQNLARAQRGDFRKTTSSSPGLHGYGHKSDDPAVKAKQAARGAQRSALTPAEKKQLNREEFDLFDLVLEFLQVEGFAETLEEAKWIMANELDEEAIAIIAEASCEDDEDEKKMKKDKKSKKSEEDEEGEEELDEASYSAKAARAGKDIGKPGKAFAKIAKSAAKRYGSKERGEKVAGAVLAKLRAKRG